VVTVFTIILILLLTTIIAVTFWVGFCLGSAYSTDELTQARLASFRAKCRMHDLTRMTFMAMADAADRHRPSPGPGSSKGQR
jgi:hypothetical protein